MIEWTKADWFAIGLALGWFANPIWRILTKIVEEAKIAKSDWKKHDK
jgi:hypothetical protein